MIAKDKNSTKSIIQKLWTLCDVLRDGGVTYHQYVIELTYLLFLKLSEVQDRESHIPLDLRWKNIISASEETKLQIYQNILTSLGDSHNSIIRSVFFRANTSIKKSSHLKIISDSIDSIEWHKESIEGIGDIYEGLLEKNSTDKKSGAGQYFTPRPIIEAIVSVMKPNEKDIIQDPAAGTGGFLIASGRYILNNLSKDKLTKRERSKYTDETFYGMEIVEDTHRLGLMNLMLHGMVDKEANFYLGDALSEDHTKLPKASLILSNPPFGVKKGGGLHSRDDLPFLTFNKQLTFLQHIYTNLKPGGRSAVVVPDNVLFDRGIGREIRKDLLDKCDVHTILRLPTGIFYAQGVKTSVLFFSQGNSQSANTKDLWIYDLRHISRSRKSDISIGDLEDFIYKYGDAPIPSLKQRRFREKVEDKHFKRFSIEDVKALDYDLDALLSEDNIQTYSDTQSPLEIVSEAIKSLSEALKFLEDTRNIMDNLDNVDR